MRRINRILSTVIVASVLFLNACKSEECEGDEEEPLDTVIAEVSIVGSHQASLEAVTDVMGDTRQARKEREQLVADKERHEIALLAAEERRQSREDAYVARKEREKKEQEEREARKKEAASPSTNNVGSWKTFEATYYGADCVGCSGVTATGMNVSNTIYSPSGHRVIAVDPRQIPLGSLVEIQSPNGTFKAVAADTGGAIKGRIVDILVGSEAESSRYGRHSVKLRILN